MKKTIIALAFGIILLAVGCTAPDSVKQADAKAYELSSNFATGSTALVTSSVQAYRKEAYNNIEFRAKVARKEGKNADLVAAWEKEKKKAVDAQAVKVLKKMLEIKGDWKKSMMLRAEVSGFLKMRPNVRDMIDAVMKENLNE